MKDELNYTIDNVIRRLYKVAARTGPDAVAADNVRICIRELRKLTRPSGTTDNEPIDIFNV